MSLINISNQNPESYYFKYKDNRYPFIYDICKYHMHYNDDKSDLLRNRFIDLDQIEKDGNINITEEAIIYIINFCQREKEKNTNEMLKNNFIPIKFLSIKLKIPDMNTIINDFISNQQNEPKLRIDLALLNLCDNDDNIQGIAENLKNYIKNDQFIQIRGNIVYKIFTYNYKNEKYAWDERDNDIICFLFKYTDKYGRGTSILYEFIDFEKISPQNLYTLLNKYQNKIDFHYLNSDCFKKIYDIESDILRRQIHNSAKIKQIIKDFKQSTKDLSSIFKSEIQSVKENTEKLNTETNQSNQIKINELFDQLQKEIESNNATNKESLSKQKDIIEENSNNINDLSKKYDEITHDIKKLRKNLNAHRTNQKNIIKEIEVFKNKNEEKFINHKNLIDDIYSFNDKQQAMIEKNFNNITDISNKYNEITQIQKNFENKINDIQNTNTNNDKKIKKEIESIRNEMKFNFQHLTNNINEMMNKFKKLTNDINEIKEENCFLKKVVCNTESMSIPDGENTIKKGYFNGLTQLKNVKLPATIKIIENNAFYGCCSLTTINFPQSLNYIQDHAFFSCTSLQKISIPYSVIEIGNYSFAQCTKLIDVSICNSIKIIGSNAFSFCNSLKTITFTSIGKIGQYTSKIGDFAFYNCHSLNEISIPISFKEIGASAFKNCRNLARISLGQNIKVIKDHAFDGCSSLTNVKLPFINYINDYTFNGCTSLEEIELTKNITTIGEYSFQNCRNLTKVILPSSVTEIKTYAFNNCTSLKIINVQDSNSYIFFGKSCFRNCNSLDKDTYFYICKICPNAFFTEPKSIPRRTCCMELYTPNIKNTIMNRNRNEANKKKILPTYKTSATNRSASLTRTRRQGIHLLTQDA